MHVSVKLSPNDDITDACLDTGCGVSLIDRTWLKSLLPDAAILKMSSPLKVRGVGTNRHETNEFVVIPIYLPGQKDGQEVLACVRRELHLVDDLRAHMLIGNDIIGPERIVIDVANKAAIIGSCGVEIAIEPKQRGEFVRRTIHAKQAMTITPYSEVLVPVKSPSIPDDRDFIFEPKPQPSLSMYAHMVDSHMSSILVANTTDHAVQIPRKSKLGVIQEIDYGNCFMTESEPSVNWAKKAAMVAATAFSFLASPPSISTSTIAPILPDSSVSRPLLSQNIEPSTMSPRTEAKLPNGVMVYGSSDERQQLGTLVDEFPSLWQDTGFVDVPEEDWMKIELRNDWQARLSNNNRAKIYPLGVRDRQVVDDTFDDLQR